MIDSSSPPPPAPPAPPAPSAPSAPSAPPGSRPDQQSGTVVSESAPEPTVVTDNGPLDGETEIGVLTDDGTVSENATSESTTDESPPWGIHCSRCYNAVSGIVRWEGFHVSDAAKFTEYLQGPVKRRFHDLEDKLEYEAEMRSLATTDMDNQYLGELLRAEPEADFDDIGEALADCLLSADPNRSVYWPWNTKRDRRAPRASLPGADLVGFSTEANGEVHLLIGEVKTSADKKSPPALMYGATGMIAQLVDRGTNLMVLNTLLQWLRCRCLNSEHRALFQQAASRVLKSRGKQIILVGMLLRDTPPMASDLRTPADGLAKKLSSPTVLNLLAWYLPVGADQWHLFISEAA